MMLVMTVISLLASARHSLIVLTLCPTSRPKSQRKVRKDASGAGPIFCGLRRARISRSISEAGNNSARP